MKNENSNFKLILIQSKKKDILYFQYIDKSFTHFWPECMKLIIKLKCHKGWYGIWYDKLFSCLKGLKMPQKVLNLKQILAFKHILFYKYDAQDIWYFKRRFAASIVITHILRKENICIYRCILFSNLITGWIIWSNML